MKIKKRKVYCGARHLITSLGVGVKDNFEAIKNYRTNLSAYSDSISICKINKANLNLTKLDGYTFLEQISILTLENVIESSQLKLSSPDTLLIISTTKGDISSLPDNIENAKLWSLSNSLEKYFDCANKPLLVSNACISATDALILASRFIENYDYENVYVFGVELLCEFIVEGFNSFKSLSDNLCKPYDKNRNGLTLGEASGAMLLSANKLLEDSVLIIGGEMSCDATHISAPSRTGGTLAYAINKAIENANIDISKGNAFINSHGTATVYNDEMESKAIELAGLRSLPLNSLKPYFGHTLGASGIVESIMAIEQMYENILFGVKTYSENGVPFELNISKEHRDMPLDCCIKTSSGFGGVNAAIIFAKEEGYVAKDQDVELIKIKEFSSVYFDNNSVDSLDFFIKTKTLEHKLKSIKFMKMDKMSKLACIACAELFAKAKADCNPEEIAIIMSNSSSSLDSDKKHQFLLEKREAGGVSPAIFVYTSANIPMAEAAIEFKISGEANFFVFENMNLDFLRKYSMYLISKNNYKVVVYGWCEFLDEKFKVDLKLLKKITMEELKKELKEKLIEALNLEDMTSDDISSSEALFGEGIGLDSIDALEISLILEKSYNIHIDDPESAKDIFYSIDTLADYIAKNRS